jgi:hypothetical protein
LVYCSNYRFVCFVYDCIDACVVLYDIV